MVQVSINLEPTRAVTQVQASNSQALQECIRPDLPQAQVFTRPKEVTDREHTRAALLINPTKVDIAIRVAITEVEQAEVVLASPKAEITSVAVSTLLGRFINQQRRNDIKNYHS